MITLLIMSLFDHIPLARCPISPLTSHLIILNSVSPKGKFIPAHGDSKRNHGKIQHTHPLAEGQHYAESQIHTNTTLYPPHNYANIHTMPQSLSNVVIHLVFSTLHREPFITSNIQTTLHAYLATLVRDQGW